MTGSISQFELGILQARMLDAARAKARREGASVFLSAISGIAIMVWGLILTFASRR
jgi:hypothetical protein